MTTIKIFLKNFVRHLKVQETFHARQPYFDRPPFSNSEFSGFEIIFVILVTKAFSFFGDSFPFESILVFPGRAGKLRNPR